jgi:predicted dehydrogenase
MIIKGAIIGCGRISHKHVDAFIANDSNMKLIGCCDIVYERASEIKEEYLNKLEKNNLKPFYPVETYKDYKEMIKKIKPDFVVVSTESGYHPQITIEALSLGVHVICEKPMALSISDADRMIEASKKYNKLLCVSFQNRFNKPIQLLKNAINQGRFGKLLYGVANIRWNRGMDYYKQAPWRGTWELDGGTLMNQCTHNIDLLQWIMGEDANEVYGVTKRYLREIEAEDFGAAIIKFKSGAVGIIEGTADIFPKNLEETLFVSGEKATVKIGGLAVNKIENWRFSDADKYGDYEEKVIGEGYNLEDKDFQAVYGFGHTPLYKNFYDALVNNGKLLIDGEAGKKALEIILAIYKSSKIGKPVKLPLKNFSTLNMKYIFDK